MFVKAVAGIPCGFGLRASVLGTCASIPNAQQKPRIKDVELDSLQLELKKQKLEKGMCDIPTLVRVQIPLSALFSFIAYTRKQVHQHITSITSARHINSSNKPLAQGLVRSHSSQFLFVFLFCFESFLLRAVPRYASSATAS